MIIDIDSRLMSEATQPKLYDGGVALKGLIANATPEGIAAAKKAATPAALKFFKGGKRRTRRRRHRRKTVRR
jgi:hypothetical protein